MARKFIRQYQLMVTSPQGEEIRIQNPITVEFDITRKNLASLNTATFTVYNLSERTRMKIFHDLYDTSTYLPVAFYAGYVYGSQETNTYAAQCFRGHVKQAYSYREGCDYKTVIECWDGGTALNNSFVSQTLPSGAKQQDVIKNLAQGMLNIVGSVVSDAFNTISNRATTLFGNPFDLLGKLTNNNFYVDSQTAFALKPDEAIKGTLNVIDETIGIVDSPKRTGTVVEVATIFEPRYVPSQEVILTSSTQLVLNGQYKLTGIQHRGIISDAVNGDCTTMLTLSALNIRKIITTNISNYFKTK
jgi:hypothetical protein